MKKADWLIMDEPPKKRRNRKFYSCIQCRRMKIKCDRKNPCSHCQKSGIRCEYRKRVDDIVKDSLDPGESVEIETNDSGTDLHSSPQNEVSIEELRSQVGDLKEKLSMVMQCVTKNQQFRTSSHSVFDMKMPKLKIYAMASKPSRTLFVGPMSNYCLSFSPTLVRYMLTALKKAMNETRHTWKKQHPERNNHIYLLKCDVKEDFLIKQIETFLCPNYFAIQERLMFFQQNLNHLLYDDFVPMATIHSLFLEHFQNPDANGLAKFIRPPKPFYYVDISAIIAMVVLVVIFTRYNGYQKKFNYELDIDISELISLQSALLNFSDFRRKKMHLALISLIALRSSTLEFSNTEGATSEHNSLPLFQMCIGCCLQMGLHRDPAGITTEMFKKKAEFRSRSLSHEETTKLWNYMIEYDTFYSSGIGSPLLINYKYCAHYSEFDKGFPNYLIGEGIRILRHSCEVINSVDVITLRNVLDLIDEVTAFCHKLPISHIVGIKDRSSDLNDVAHVFRLKFLLMNTLQCLCKIVIKGVIALFQEQSDYLEDTNTRQKLIKLARTMMLQTMFSAQYSLFHMKLICDGKSIFGKELNSIYIIYFREIFNAIIAQCAVIGFTFAISKGTNTPQIISSLNPDPIFADYPPDYPDSTISLNEKNVEDATFYKYSKMSMKQMEALAYKILEPSIMVSFYTDFYNSAVSNQSIYNSMDGCMSLTGLLLCISALKALAQAPLEARPISVQVLMERTKQMIDTSFNPAKFSTMNTDPPDFDVEKVFNSLLVDSDWSKLVHDLSQEETASLDGVTNIQAEYEDMDPGWAAQ